MKVLEAMTIVHNGLVGYVEDSAGAGSEEAKTLDQAWNKLKESLPNEERFPNGFDSWYETHHELVSMAALHLKYDIANSVIFKTQESEGQFGVHELIKNWTDEFELTNKGRSWDGEFLEEVEKFFNKKCNK